LSSQVQTVMKVVLNTLNYQEHRCRPLPSTLILDEPCGRSRGVCLGLFYQTHKRLESTYKGVHTSTNASCLKEISRTTLANVGDLEHITEHETPPMTPLSVSNASPSMSLKREQRKSLGSISSATKQAMKKILPAVAMESFDFL
jgi:hypothetical protein